MRTILIFFLVLAMLPLAAQAQTSTVLIGGCVSFTDIGNTGRSTSFIIANDISVSGPQLCINIEQSTTAPPARLDCQGHNLAFTNDATFAQILNVNKFQLINCNVSMDPTLSPSDAGAYPTGLSLAGSASVLAGNNLSYMTASISSPGAVITNNTLYDAGFLIASANNVQVLNNTITLSAHLYTQMIGIYVQDSNYPLIAYNTITSQGGNDDGIVLWSSPGLTATGEQALSNTISNFDDCLIELAGRHTNMTVSQNVGDDSGGAGSFFCGYYGTGLENSTISNNTVKPSSRRTASLFYFIYEAGEQSINWGEATKAGTVLFNNNQVLNNSSGGVEIDFSQDYLDGYMNVLGPGDVTKNVFTGNTFTPVDLTPASGFVDGGGNHCSSTVPPIVCH